LATHLQSRPQTHLMMLAILACPLENSQGQGKIVLGLATATFTDWVVWVVRRYQEVQPATLWDRGQLAQRAALRLQQGAVLIWLGTLLLFPIVIAIVIGIAVAILSCLFAVNLDKISNRLGWNSILLSNFMGVDLEDSHLKYYVSYLIIR